MYLAQLYVPYDAIRCTDKSCTSHKKEIESFYNNITGALQRGTADCILSGSVSKHNEIPGWKEYVKEYHSIAREMFLTWESYGKPRNGVLFENMKQSRARFKYALRFCQRIEETTKADALDKELSEKDCIGFWKSVKRINQRDLL